MKLSTTSAALFALFSIFTSTLALPADNDDFDLESFDDDIADTGSLKTNEPSTPVSIPLAKPSSASLPPTVKSLPVTTTSKLPSASAAGQPLATFPSSSKTKENPDKAVSIVSPPPKAQLQLNPTSTKTPSSLSSVVQKSSTQENLASKQLASLPQSQQAVGTIGIPNQSKQPLVGDTLIEKIPLAVPALPQVVGCQFHAAQFHYFLLSFFQGISLGYDLATSLSQLTDPSRQFKASLDANISIAGYPTLLAYFQASVQSVKSYALSINQQCGTCDSVYDILQKLAYP
ncbi:hypothetical protein NEOLI_004549 [Neolecta irregularis DAH-3]|uniref:Uncharacterized protein n=1 Tax=Neolecta irregularis (strain DAH-3) TaxID=1198029 RepID=A0A1U7LS78_NEOID|nr:hypothetical protein NEOLI_004549 [Neolecta irregularis DAH-3]|eukprot:OLL25517.1 hypothetical protein NEOLI_004549 [Neolecta irregularis DAH-3]